MNRVLLNLGCGLVAPDRWQNFDASLHQYLASHSLLDQTLGRLGLTSDSKWPKNVRYLNLNRRWPFPDSSVDVVYSHHVFEHLSHRSSELYLAEARRVLRPDGVVRVVVPDLLQHAQEYLRSLPLSGPGATERFLDSINLQPPRPTNPIRAAYEWYSGYPSVHKTMYDEPTLRAALGRHDFRHITIEARGQSARIPEIADVESGTYECSLYVEAQK